MKNEIVLFENQNVKLEVNMKDETVWLSLEQMANLFNRDRTVITKHINNIFKNDELKKEEVCAKFAHTTKHGAMQDKTQTRELDYYNLDMIISVGYRVNSKQGITFRKWATKVLKDYMIKGYAVNQKRLEYLEKTIKLIDIAGRIDIELKGSDAQEIIKVINNYSNALNLLDDYDHKRIAKPHGTTNNNKIVYEDCINIVNKLKFKCLYSIQRVALIRTLAVDPDILLLDEPFSALDYQTRLALSDDLYKIIKNEGKTAIMVTHDIAEAISMSDRIILLTKRPSVVKQIYNIELENKQNPVNNRQDKNFFKYYDQIWKEIDNYV